MNPNTHDRRKPSLPRDRFTLESAPPCDRRAGWVDAMTGKRLAPLMSADYCAGWMEGFDYRASQLTAQAASC